MSKYDPADGFDRWQMAMVLGELEGHIDALDHLFRGDGRFMEMFGDVKGVDAQGLQQLYFDFANAVDTYKILQAIESMEEDRD